MNIQNKNKNATAGGHTFSNMATRGGGIPFKEGLKGDICDKNNF